eukprot:1084338-Lingulodinium_polyedra.AAC.1
MAKVEARLAEWVSTPMQAAFVLDPHLCNWVVGIEKGRATAPMTCDLPGLFAAAKAKTRAFVGAYFVASRDKATTCHSELDDFLLQ